jgi:hypothetical protein
MVSLYLLVSAYYLRKVYMGSSNNQETLLLTWTVIFFLWVYVDDLIIACTDLDTIKTVKLQVAERYKVKDMGEMDWYLGMRYTRSDTTGTITLDQCTRRIR